MGAEQPDDLARRHRTLAVGQRIAKLVSWAEDPETGEVDGAESLIELFDVPPEIAFGGPDAWFGLVHPEDLPALQEQLLPARAEGRRAEYVVRIPAGEGWRWVRGISCSETVDGTLRRWGTLQDVTPERRMELELEKQMIVNVLSEAVASVANEAATLEEALLGLRSIVLADPGWSEVYAHRVTVDGLETMQSPELGPQRPDEAALQLAVQAQEAGELVWNEALTDIAFPLKRGGETLAVVGIHSDVPTKQQELTSDTARRAAFQLERVIERETAEAELAAARDQALAASRAKSEFLATMSHEIRTPLNAVLGMAELLGASSLDSDQQELVARVTTAGRTLLDLINDVLDLSRVEAGGLVLEHVGFDVREVLDSAIGLLAAQAEAKGIALSISWSHEVPARLQGDPVRLAQIVTNLVSNAVKFTARGEVVVTVSAGSSLDAGTSGAHLQIGVSDTGAGIDPDVLEQLFDTFTQADASTTRLHGGSGLGLSIARRLARSMGGDVTAVSRPGHGSTFTVDVVLERDSAAAGAAPETARPADAPALPEAGPPRTILVVEDNEVNQIISRRMLELLGHSVDSAEDGQAAVELFDPERHDLVFMDVQMPRLDGYAATRLLRERHADSPRTPILALTANAVAGERERCVGAGMDDLLPKPVDLRKLADAVARWTARGSSGSDAGVETRPETSSEAVPTLDDAHLEELRLMDEPGWSYLDQTIDNLSSSAPLALSGAREAAGRGDDERLRFVIHKLAGSVLNLGMREAGLLARELENSLPLPSEAALSRIAEVSEAVERGLRALQGWRTPTA